MQDNNNKKILIFRNAVCPRPVEGGGGCSDVSAQGFGFWEHKHTHQPFSVCCGHPLSVQHKGPPNIELKGTRKDGRNESGSSHARAFVLLNASTTKAHRTDAHLYSRCVAGDSSDSRLIPFY